MSLYKETNIWGNHHTVVETQQSNRSNHHIPSKRKVETIKIYPPHNAQNCWSEIFFVYNTRYSRFVGIAVLTICVGLVMAPTEMVVWTGGQRTECF